MRIITSHKCMLTSGVDACASRTQLTCVDLRMCVQQCADVRTPAQACAGTRRHCAARTQRCATRRCPAARMAARHFHSFNGFAQPCGCVRRIAQPRQWSCANVCACAALRKLTQLCAAPRSDRPSSRPTKQSLIPQLRIKLRNSIPQLRIKLRS